MRGRDQSLFRRDQLRQLLTLLREADEPLYLRTIHDLLLGESVRFHLQHLVLRLLSTWSAPLDSEIDLVVEMYKRPAWINFVIREILWSNDAFFEAFVQRGIFQSQLASAEDSQVNVALFVMRGVTPKLVVLLRLYEQSQGRGDRLTQEKCLDGWDLMLRRGTGGTRDQLAALDA